MIPETHIILLWLIRLLINRSSSLSPILFFYHFIKSTTPYFGDFVPIFFLFSSYSFVYFLCIIEWSSDTFLSSYLLTSTMLLGSMWIEQEELRISRYAQSVLTSDPRVFLLGRTDGWLPLDGTETHNLPIFSFLIRRGHRFLHHNFVCALLNYLFGVQSRGEMLTLECSVFHFILCTFR